MERRQFLQTTVLGASATILGIASSLPAVSQTQLSSEDTMTSQVRPYEPLTSDNAALILVGSSGWPHDWRP
jgi:hypothetical protein